MKQVCRKNLPLIRFQSYFLYHEIDKILYNKKATVIFNEKIKSYLLLDKYYQIFSFITELKQSARSNWLIQRLYYLPSFAHGCMPLTLLNN